MKTWCVSDLHFSHRSILKYCPHRVDSSYTKDINTATPDEIDHLVHLMNERIISNWNSLINPEDQVFILGDCAMGMISKAPPLISRLNGKKTLVLGNHDKSLVKLIKNNPEHHDLFVEICDYKEIWFKVDDVKRLICMSHYPMKYWNMSSNVVSSCCFHGHVHSSPENIHIGPGNTIDCGIDGNHLFPRLLEDAVRLAVANGIKNPISHHH